MKKFGRLFFSAAVLCLVISLLAGCGGLSWNTPFSALDKAERYLRGGNSKIIYIITSSRTNPFFQTIVESATARAGELGYEIRFSSHGEDMTKQSDFFENAISDQAAAIICAHAGAEGMTDDMKQAREANIPTVLIDRTISEEGLAIAQIQANNEQGAAAIAKTFVEAMGRQGKYAELVGKESNANALVRSRAFHEVIDQYPEMKMVARESAHWSHTEAAEITENILQTYPDVKGIICGNDTMAMGALEAIRYSGINGIVVVGIDGSENAAEAIREGSMTGTVLQPAGLMGKMAVEEADLYIRTGSTGQPERQLVDCIVITKENVNRLNNFMYQ